MKIPLGYLAWSLVAITGSAAAAKEEALQYQFATGQTAVYLRAQVLDQYGNAYANHAVPQLKVQVPGLAASPLAWSTTTDSSGMTVVDLPVTGLTPGAARYQLRAWIDDNPTDGAIQSAETKSNLVLVTVTP